MTERWLPIRGFEGRYEVSDHGRVRSLPRVLVDCLGRHRRMKGYVLRPGGHARRKGVMDYQVAHLGKGAGRSVHTLVLETFVGPRPDGMTCRHLDGNCRNNRLDNLSWATHAENIADKVLHGTYTMGVEHHLSRFSEDDIRCIRAEPDWRGVQRMLGRRFGVAQQTISSIRRRERWAHVPDYFPTPLA